MKFLAAFAFLLALSPTANALEEYPSTLNEGFMNWCTGTQDQPQTACSCALNKAALEIPAAGLASFLSAAEGGGLASVSSGVGATAVQIIATCAAGGGNTATGGGSMLNALGGMMKR